VHVEGLVPVPAGGVVVLGAAGAGSLEHPAATSAIARNPSWERTFMDEFTPLNIAASRRAVKSLTL
jgi:hypothetical protein